ncbi:MAG: hypothetical protein N3H31_07315 [Candidatus Nezhaarchaeota archaeon]|nr:hypothetical protein [Candidatus Nezhaarchaeota archaeon]
MGPLSPVDIRLFKLSYGKVVASGARPVIPVGSLRPRGLHRFFRRRRRHSLGQSAGRLIGRAAQSIDPTLPVDVEPRTYATSEIVELARRRARVIREVVAYGKLLAGGEELVRTLKFVAGQNSAATRQH